MSAGEFRITRSTRYDDLPEWLTVSEVATLLGVARWTVYEHVHQGHVPHRRIGSKVILIPRSFVDPSALAQAGPSVGGDDAAVAAVRQVQTAERRGRGRR